MPWTEIYQVVEMPAFAQKVAGFHRILQLGVWQLTKATILQKECLSGQNLIKKIFPAFKRDNFLIKPVLRNGVMFQDRSQFRIFETVKDVVLLSMRFSCPFGSSIFSLLG